MDGGGRDGGGSGWRWEWMEEMWESGKWSRIESWGWERQHRLTDKRLVGADGGEGEIAHPPPDDQGQDNVHRTKHAHQDKTCLHEVVSSSDIADLIM